nr:sigma-70 family RNA polymerase sigma factor [uncultured Oscillibacter sp.]
MLTEQQFTDAVERYLDMVYRIALNWFRNPADAEDAAQNAMLRLWRTDTEFQGEDHLRHWLVRVTLNECKRMSAHPWRRRTVPLDQCPEPVFSDPARQTLYQEVMELPVKYRVPLYLYYYEGYKVDEVGELLGLNASTVQTRLARARAKLKTQLKEG